MPHKNKTPYIGVTDFITRYQVEQAKTVLSPKRRLHVGAMTSYKVLNSIATSSGWENIWLDSNGLSQLFVADEEVYNVIHYADYGHDLNQDAPTTVDDLNVAVQLSGPHVDCIQLDMVWPSIALVEAFKQANPTIDVILQVSSKAVAEAPPSHSLASMVHPYAGLVDYFLLDSGMGRGTPFDITMMDQHIQELLACGIAEDSIAVAGGLGPDTYFAIKPLLDLYPTISCDAQGRLRPSHSAIDPIDITMVVQYVAGVSSLIR